MAAMLETSPLLDLTPQDIEQLATKLREYHALFAPCFRRSAHRQWSEDYLHGLLLNLPRKSTEPIVLALRGSDLSAIRSMQFFIGHAPWQDAPIRQRHWQQVNTTLGEEQGVLTLDGSDFAKQGNHSAGVKRQHCGELGKRANCQAGVFLGYAGTKGYTLLDARLYIPEEWLTAEPFAERRRRALLPEGLEFATKPALGKQMIQKLVESQVLQARWLVCDEAFGQDRSLLDAVAECGLWYFAEVQSNNKVWQTRPDTEVPAYRGVGQPPKRLRLVEQDGQPPLLTLREVAEQLPAGEWSQHVVKEGAKGPLVAEFAALRVVARRDDLPGPEVWLVLRRNPSSSEVKYYLSNAPAEVALSRLVWVSGMRWPIESCFKEGKQHLGMGDYEVRTFLGWHHHMTLVMLAHHFLVGLGQGLKKTVHG